jgi:hypothetical protein
MTAAFSILLNGIEALGSFIPHDKEPIEREHYKKNKRGVGNYFSFRAFIREYMRDWDDEVKGTSYKDKKTGNLYRKVYLPLILWDKFRNSIAHSFVVESGGIDYKADPTGWVVEANGYLEIGPVNFFKDFLSGVDNFFNNVRTKHKKEFLKSFRDAYPC